MLRRTACRPSSGTSRSGWASRGPGCPGSSPATGAAPRRARTGSPPPRAAPDLDDPARLLWDSGRRESGDGLLVPWDGPVLRSATRYHWRVEVWDETGAAAGAAQSWFETGLLHRDDWTAVWVGRDPLGLPPVDPPQRRPTLSPSTGALPPPLYLRRAFELARRPVRARLYATARGVYEPRLNGARVGDAELAPGWTEYHQRLQYQTYDVTDAAARGRQRARRRRRRRLVVRVRRLRPRRPALHYGDAPAFLAQLVVDFADGSRQVVATDARLDRAARARSAPPTC